MPLQPLPPEWEEGNLPEIAESPSSIVDIDSWAREMNELCAESARDDEEIMRRAIDEHRRQAKDQVRREMRLPE